MKLAKTLDRSGLLPILMLASAAVISLSVNLTATAAALSPATEAAVLGGSDCGFAAGLAGGLGIAGLFGCLVCGVAGTLLGLGLLVVC